jgi:lysophospholipase L1-like esterase
VNHHIRSLLLALVLATSAGSIAANTAIEPVPRNGTPARQHTEFVEIARKGGVDLLFLGDSITDFWRTRGKAVWDREYAPLHAANFGINADRTQHVLWRMQNGELDGLAPKAVVLMIGTNNCGLENDGKTPRNTTPEVIEGVTAIVQGLRAKLPAAKILLLGIFPRARKGDPADIRDQIATVNAAIAKLDDGKFVKYLDIGPKFLKADGTLDPEDFVADLLHPSEKGYEVWAAAIRQPLADLMR